MVVEIVNSIVEDGGQTGHVVFRYSEKTGGRDEDVGLLFRSSTNGQGQE